MRAPSRRTAIIGGVATVVAGRGLMELWDANRPGAAATTQAGKVHADVFDDPDAPVLGNPAGRVAIAEFYDYRCPFCRRMHPAIDRLLREENDVRFVAKLWPILGPGSVRAARVALAANWQGRFGAMNGVLFSIHGTLDDMTVHAAAVDAGVDMDRLRHDLANRSAVVDRSLRRVSREATALGLQGTPALMVGPYLVPGALDEKQLRKLVDRVRRG